MNALLLLPSGLALTLLTLSAVCVAQTTVYRHVDENGVVTFSDTPPDASVEAEEMRIQAQTAQDPNAYLQNLDAMRESTDRMVADRQEREAPVRAQADQCRIQPAVSADLQRTLSRLRECLASL